MVLKFPLQSANAFDGAALINTHRTNNPKIAFVQTAALPVVGQAPYGPPMVALPCHLGRSFASACGFEEFPPLPGNAFGGVA